MHTACFNTKIGYLTLTEEDGVLIRLSFGECGKHEETEFLRGCILQVEEYLEGHRREFDIPVELRGTPFCKEVWEQLRKIPYGRTASYAEVAGAVGREKAFRAVGMACGKNPVAIIIPCHRVVGKNGSLTGFAGGLKIKERLLETERKS